MKKYSIAFDSVLANEKEFNTSSQKLKTSILYIIEVSTEVESLKLISFSQENVDTWYHLDLKADDSKRYFNIGTCHSLIANINSTAAAASFRCSPELDSRNSWYQEMALITKSSRNEGTSWVNISDNNFTPDINVSFERDKTAKGTVNFSKRFLMIQNSFLFLDSFLTIDLNSIVKTIQYRNTRDISLIKKDGEFVVERVPHSLKPVDGEITTIQCETFGRNPPPIRVERNGMAILDADDVFILSINTNLRTSSSVTFLHNTKEMEGNYTCVLGDEGKDMVPLYVFELKPRVPRDLMQKSILQNGTFYSIKSIFNFYIYW